MPTTYAIPNGRTAMDATLYTGNNTTSRTITNTDTGTNGFYPDFLWIKDRSQPLYHTLMDSARGASGGAYGVLFSNATLGEYTTSNQPAWFSSYGNVSSLTSSGFVVSVGSTTGNFNTNPDNYVAWQWNAGSNTAVTNTTGTITSTVRANTTAGFSIVTFNNPTSGAYTVGHGLSAAPQLVIIKYRSGASNWFVYSASIGYTNRLLLNTTSASAAATYWTSAPTATTVNFDSSFADNPSQSLVMYCWAPIPGFSAFGSYTGNANADGPFVYTGFRPKYLLIKNTVNGVADWTILDSSRNPYNVANSELNADLSDAEYTANAADFLSNGFKLRSTYGNTNGSGQLLIYAAFAENPFKYANAR